MTTRYHYISLQYSAIQKTVMRHYRLWSMAGISGILSEINEIELPRIVKKNGGTALVAGGGKFTARFPCSQKAKDALRECKRIISTRLPMLEYQYTSLREAPSLKALMMPSKRTVDSVEIIEPGLYQELKEQKRCFRGYAVTYNPHLQLCDECGEYPAVCSNKKCRVCDEAETYGKGNPDRTHANNGELTSIQKIYRVYFKGLNCVDGPPEIPIDFEDLFPSDNKEKRMALWLSDLNSMGDKLRLWGDQEDEKIKDTFSKVTNLNVDCVCDALKKTFKDDSIVEGKDKRKNGVRYFIPFRLIIAGGDDLCIVMPYRHVTNFALNLSTAFHKKLTEIEQDSHNPLSKAWLEVKAASMKEAQDIKEPKPISFGASFIIANHDSPFWKLHETGEDLMGEAKSATGRMGNSINWLVLHGDEKERVDGIQFHRPLFIDNASNGEMTFKDYNDRLKLYGNMSMSSVQNIADLMSQHGDDPQAFEGRLKKSALSSFGKYYGYLLVDANFRKDKDLNKSLDIPRIATLLELVSITK